MRVRNRNSAVGAARPRARSLKVARRCAGATAIRPWARPGRIAVSYTHLRAHETVLDFVCRLLLEKKKELIPDTLSEPHGSERKGPPVRYGPAAYKLVSQQPAHQGDDEYLIHEDNTPH